MPSKKHKKKFGAFMEEYRVGTAKQPTINKTRSASRTKVTKKYRPRLNPAFDVFDQSIQTLAGELQRTFDDPAEVESLEEEGDTCPGEGQTLLEEDKLDSLPYDWLQMDTAMINDMIRSIEDACGEPPSTSRDVPGVIGIYALFGQQAENNSESHVYVGQARSTKPNRDTGRGIRSRSTQHYQKIQTQKRKLSEDATAKDDTTNTQERPMLVYQRFARVQSSMVRIALLSVFPFPDSTLGSKNFHINFMLQLAETLDVLLLNSLTMQDPANPTACYRLSFGENFEPLKLPRWNLRGANRALPSKQNVRPGSSLISMFWSPEEIGVFIDMVQQHESEVYSPRCVQWHLMSELLEAQGVRKSAKEIKTLYLTLRDTPDVVFISHRVSAWRGFWSELVSLKKYLTENRHVHPPKDDNDLFHHIPALEDGRQTVDFIEALLPKTDDRTGFQRNYTKVRFLQEHLAQLLHRDVWERITGPPPTSMALSNRFMGKVVTDRVVAVMMHHGRKLYGEEDHGEETATSTAGLPQLTWPRALELWHATKSDLMASGVPPDQIFPGGIPQILRLWHTNKKSFWDAEHALPLPLYEFEPGVQKGEAQCFPVPTMTRAAHDSDDAEAHSCTGIPRNTYVWPSDADKYTALASSMKDFSDTTSQVQPRPSELAITLPSTISGPAQLAQHQVSTFRLLVSIMQRYHREVFDCDSNHTSDEAFWEVLYIGPLSGEWHIQDIRRLKDRFDWVLDYVREGWVIDSEAMVAKDILREVLASNVLSRNKHPYNTDIAQPTLDYLKPDLCPKWIKRLLATSGVLPEVESLIQSRFDHMGIAGFCDKYGLLIAPLWEDFSLSQNDEEFSIDRGWATQAYINVDEFELEQHGREIGPQPLLPSALASVGDPEKPPSPLKRKAPAADQSDPGDAPDTEKAPKRRNLRPRAPRVNSEASVTSTIATTTPLPGAPIQPSFSASTGTSSLVTPPVPPTASSSRSSRVQVQKQAMALPEPPMKGTKSFWTMEQDDWLRDVHAQNISVNDQVPLFKQRFGFDKSSDSIRDRAKRLDLKTRHKEEHRWTSAEDKLLRSLRPSEIEPSEHVSIDQVCKSFWAKFGQSRSKGAINIRLHVLDGKYPETTQKWWSDEELAFLRNSTDLQPDHAALADALNAKFGTQRSAASVKRKLAWSTVKLQHPNAPWSPEEDDFIRTYPDISTTKHKEVAAALNAEFGTNRSASSVKSRIAFFTVKAQPNLPWSPEEDDFIRAWPGISTTNYKEAVVALNAKFGTQRSMYNVRRRIPEVIQLQVREAWTKAEEDFALNYDGTARALTAALNEKFGTQRNFKGVRDKLQKLRRQSRKAKSNGPGDADL